MDGGVVDNQVDALAVCLLLSSAGEVLYAGDWLPLVLLGVGDAGDLVEARLVAEVKLHQASVLQLFEALDLLLGQPKVLLIAQLA